jgi:peptide/nickel transport system substrate-binding protein
MQRPTASELAAVSAPAAPLYNARVAISLRLLMFCRMMKTSPCLLALLLFAAGCASSAAPAGNTLIYGQPEDPKTLDPINTDIAEAVHVITNVFDTLVTYDEKTTDLVPGLAEKWEASSDGTEWTFHLRPGVKFHDGTPCDAQAVKTTFERLIVPDHPLVFDPVLPYQSSYKMIRSVEAPDAGTVVFKLNEPSAIFLSNLAMFPASIVSPAALQEYAGSFAEHPVGTGPFRFVKWTRDQQLVLARNPEYFLGPPKLDHLIFVPVKENATRVQRLTRGEIQITENLTPVEMDVLAKNPALVVQEQEALNVAYLTMQLDKPPLDNLKVREAIWMAIDKRALIDVGYSGHAIPAVTLVPPAMWGHDDELQDRPFDPERAKAFLEEASRDAGFPLPLKLTLAVMNQARPYLQQPLATAGFLKDSLRKIGIELTIVGRDVNQHFQYVMAGQHQLGLAGWNSDNSDPDNFLYSLLDPDNIAAEGNNLSHYRSRPFHELLLAGQRELDAAKRKEIYYQAQALAFADAPVVPLVHTKTRVAHAKGLKGYQLHPTGLVRLRGCYFEEAP